MKKQLILSCLLGMMSVCAMAQLEVQESGKVMIGVTQPLTAHSKLSIGSAGTYGSDVSVLTDSTDGITVLTSSNKAGVRVKVRNYPEQWSGSVTGIKVETMSNLLSNTAYSVHVTHGLSLNRSFGISSQYLSVASPSTPTFASIYGSVNVSSPSLLSGRYAGYFDGDVKVAGGGTLYATLLTPSGTSSMMNRGGTSDVLSEEEPVGTKLSNVRLVRLYREPELQEKALAEGVVVPEGMELEDVQPQTPLASVQYCLAADQLREVYPELVYEDKNGNVSINYIEMIPLLVQANNELRARVAALEAETETRVQQSKNMMAAQAPLPWEGMEEGLLLSLGQNNPNPFSEQTSIEVSVPETVATAALLIFDMQGKQVRKIDIDARGISRITVTGQGLTEGMYLYSLIADGKVVQTKKMILSK